MDNLLWFWFAGILPAFAMTVSLEWVTTSTYKSWPNGVFPATVVILWILAPFTWVAALLFYGRYVFIGLGMIVRWLLSNQLASTYKQIWRHFFPKNKKPAELPKAKVVK